GRADDNACSGGTQRGYGLIENCQPTAGLDHVLCAEAPGQFEQGFHRVTICRIERVGCSELRRQLEASRAHIHRNDSRHRRERQAMTATRPTPPAPKTTMVLPGSGRATLNTAPAPVWMLQANGASCERSRSSSTFTADLALSKA